MSDTPPTQRASERPLRCPLSVCSVCGTEGQPATHSLTVHYECTQSISQSISQPLTCGSRRPGRCSLTPSLTHSLTHSPSAARSHSLTHSVDVCGWFPLLFDHALTMHCQYHRCCGLGIHLRYPADLTFETPVACRVCGLCVCCWLDLLITLFVLCSSVSWLNSWLCRSARLRCYPLLQLFTVKCRGNCEVLFKAQ